METSNPKDKLIVKFNDQNGCTVDDVKAYAKLPYKNKLFFTIKDWSVEKWGVLQDQAVYSRYLRNSIA